MNKKRLFAAVIAGTMIVGSMLSVHAAPTDYDTISQEEVSEEISAGETAEAKRAEIREIVTQAITNAVSCVRRE